jgi:hypothetical protein
VRELKIILWCISLLVAYLGIAAVGYWEVKYWLSFGNGKGEGEFREGGAITMLYTASFWLPLAIYSFVKFKKLSKGIIFINLAPLVFMLSVYLLWLI